MLSANATVAELANACAFRCCCELDEVEDDWEDDEVDENPVDSPDDPKNVEEDGADENDPNELFGDAEKAFAAKVVFVNPPNWEAMLLAPAWILTPTIPEACALAFEDVESRAPVDSRCNSR
ncbi:hypothetical protein HDU79_007915 [Rhizoclosmatium sp. JEL0117]|nr:hypothetical protein HDU79_007915 [Rhizoclosmatium sp. JEL0117]